MTGNDPFSGHRACLAMAKDWGEENARLKIQLGIALAALEDAVKEVQRLAEREEEFKVRGAGLAHRIAELEQTLAMVGDERAAAITRGEELRRELQELKSK